MRFDFNDTYFLWWFVSWLGKQLQKKSSLELMHALPVRGMFSYWKGTELEVENLGWFVS